MTGSRTKEYTRFLMRTSWYKHAGELNAPELCYLTLGLAGESGEAADEVKKVVREAGMFDVGAFQEQMRDNMRGGKLAHELGDVLWYLTQLARFLGLTLDDLMAMNTAKLYDRYQQQDYVDRLAEPVNWPLSDIMRIDAGDIHPDISRDI